MGTYAVTGSASGMGRATADLLRADGHTVIGVDLHEADVLADLSTIEGRAQAASEVLVAAGGSLDGAVLAAGIGPGRGGSGRARLIAQVNYRGVVDLLEQWRPALSGPHHAKVVVVASNSATTTPVVPVRTVRMLMSGNVDRALRSVRVFGPGRTAIMYAASKIAVSRWVRRTAVRPQWAGEGIRLNALAPGAVRTPLLEEQLATPQQRTVVRRFPIPTDEFGETRHLGSWARFMLTEAADFLSGSVVCVDGGTDALFRADDWPRPVPLRRLPSYLRTFLGRSPHGT